MIVRMGLFNRKAGLAEPAFLDHWRATHGPLIRDCMPELSGYVQNHVTDSLQRSIDYPRLPIELDGISQLFFQDLGSARRSSSADTISRLQADEENFLQNLLVVTALQNVVVPPPPAGQPAVKRMSLLHKRDDITVSEFQDQWLGLHAQLVSRIPGLIGYRQNLVLEIRSDRLSDNDQAPDASVDGVVELWFADVESIETGFRSQRGLTVMTHAREFIGQISTYMVDPFVVLPEQAPRT